MICGRREEVLEGRAELGQATGGKCRRRSATCATPRRRHDDPEIWSHAPLDMLVNNAAANFIARTDKLSHRAIDAVLDIVLHGASIARSSAASAGSTAVAAAR